MGNRIKSNQRQILLIGLNLIFVILVLIILSDLPLLIKLIICFLIIIQPFFYIISTFFKKTNRSKIAIFDNLEVNNVFLKHYFSIIEEAIILVNSNLQVLFINEFGDKLLEDFAIKVNDDITKTFINANQFVSVNQLINQKNIGHCTFKYGKLVIRFSQTKLVHKNQLIGFVLRFENITNIFDFDDVQTNFIADVSHELKTPLSAIIGASNIIKGKVEAINYEAHDFLDLLIDESQRMNKIITDFLQMSLLGPKGLELEKKCFPLRERINKVLLKIKFREEKEAIEIKNEVPPKITIYADEIRIEQVFNNLLSNAIRYTDKGSIRIIHHVEENFDVISIIDTGIGISPKEQVNLFQRFYRVDTSRQRQSGGSGIGLYIVKLYVEQHQGYATVHSKLNRGSTFTIKLPKK